MFNKIIIMGRFGKDPELRTTPTGTPVATFSLAVDRDGKNKQTGERETDWFQCVAWNGTAEFLTRHFRRGDAALIEGRMQFRRWKDAEGRDRLSPEVSVNNIYFAGKQERAEELQKTGFHEIEDPDDGDIPF